MAYLGDAPGNYALKQLYGRNYSTAMQKLALLEHSHIRAVARSPLLGRLNSLPESIVIVFEE